MEGNVETKTTDLKQLEKKPIIKNLLHDVYLYVKNNSVANTEISEEQEVVNNLHEAKKELDEANASFEHADDNDLVDFYIYQAKAAETKYQYLLKKIKRKQEY